MDGRGSSPRMRGTHLFLKIVKLVAGIIPAYAGNTGTFNIRGHFYRDHPRVCGEHRSGHHHDAAYRGSSPRMRGTHVHGIGLLGHLGIIPAYAGNTEHVALEQSARWDHPRVCGEHAETWIQSSLPQGSSPRMRGTHHQRHRKTRRPGIIPAYAGNTDIAAKVDQYQTDHPRVCGEHPLVSRMSISSWGSSPRMRGTLQRRSQRHQPPGIIPAYAGNTIACDYPTAALRDHPRVCGEHPHCPLRLY